jgi:hypothetical protein
MVDGADQKIVVKGYMVKGRWHDAKLEASKDPIVLDDGWQNMPQPWIYTLCSNYV